MAKSKTTSKKTKTKKKTSRRASTDSAKSTAGPGKTAAKEPGVKKSPAGKSTAKKTSAKRKTKVKKAPARKPAKKKTAAKKTGSTKKMAKKTTKKKTAVKKPVTEEAPAENANKKPATAKKKDRTRTAKAKRTTAAARRRGQSVAEAASVTEADQQGYVFINGRRVRMISTKGQAVVRKPKAAGQPIPEEAGESTLVRPVKTHLSRKELNHYRNLLLATRMQLCGSLSAMEDQALNPDGGNLSHMPIHMADIGTDTFDQDFMLGLAESERQRLREIDEALQRIEDRTYGICQMTGQPIPAARLEAKPWAKYTIEAARALEGQWGA